MLTAKNNPRLIPTSGVALDGGGGLNESHAYAEPVLLPQDFGTTIVGQLPKSPDEPRFSSPTHLLYHHRSPLSFCPVTKEMTQSIKGRLRAIVVQWVDSKLLWLISSIRVYCIASHAINESCMLVSQR